MTNNKYSFKYTSLEQWKELTLKANEAFGRALRFRLGNFIITADFRKDWILDVHHIYRNEKTGVIIARMINVQEQALAQLVVYPDGTKHFIKDMRMADAKMKYLWNMS